MGRKLVQLDDPSPLPSIGAVGGKGYSLIRMRREGLPVPPGFVLAVDFFAPWIEAVMASEAWGAFVEASEDTMEARASLLPSVADSFSFDEEQALAVSEALERLADHRLFAVRSSSPEEDLAGASFAGGYETVLGATRQTLESAVRRAFSSCLQPRVFVYKRARGFEVHAVRIAVVVQAQIDSEVAGVGFSVEPISNDYDRAVFDANWGLGESVVSGLASPDQYVVDKVSGEVTESSIGAKETSVWLLPDGGTEERADDRTNMRTLTDEQLRLMTSHLSRIEKLYGKPMDIEWAWRRDRFYVLQARPITTYLPLPDEVLTEPGARRRLYLDATLAIQGIQAPMSVMGLDVLEILLGEFARRVTGDIRLVGKEGLVHLAGGRMYVSLSHLFHLVDPNKLGEVLSNLDTLVGEILEAIDPEVYRSAEVPASAKHLVPKAVAHVADVPLKVLRSVLLPDHEVRVYHRNVDRVLDAFENDADAPKRVSEYAVWLARRFVQLMVGTLIPPLASALASRSRLTKLFRRAAEQDDAVADALVRIDQALPGNVTIEMGMELHAIAEGLRASSIPSLDDLSRRFESRDLPADTLERWDAFIARFGFRGPRELDIAAPRYTDRPELLYGQVDSMMRFSSEGTDPTSIHARSVERRKEAHLLLRRRAHDMGALEGTEYDLLYRAVEHFGGYRENHKYYLVRTLSFLRRRVLAEGEALVRTGRLGSIEQVFDLKLEDLARGLEDQTLDLEAIARENTAFLRQLSHVLEFPHVVDSRGRILRPKPRQGKPGELVGQPISPGKATGPVKVLRSPDEKRVEPGDVLVARATDPGWTPLFVNAAAIVLEVGGMLQHGSLVAREYGKPCVAGVHGATATLEDGMVVEVDGAAGIVSSDIGGMGGDGNRTP